ncbi:hypothetical protein CRN47_10480 [Vibrio vulnificus]|nr:hypothetical protein CRN33_06625 [Vibrio vulnificus]POB24687.1 hypothetical protein CRN47_10480 [Vibrio vulnificus]
MVITNDQNRATCNLCLLSRFGSRHNHGVTEMMINWLASEFDSINMIRYEMGYIDNVDLKMQTKNDLFQPDWTLH